MSDASHATSARDAKPARAVHMLDAAEVAPFLEISNWRALGSIAFNWTLVAAAAALVAWRPNALSILLALFVIGARQLGFAVLMHDAAHRSLLRTRGANDFVAQWFCAYPIWSDTLSYRTVHLRHHAHTGSARDPDLGLIRPFPVTRQSFARKVLRDLTGRTGFKFARAAFARSFARGDAGARRAALGALVTNGALLAIATAVGAPALYLLWAGAWLTTYTLLTRIRSIAEHALTPAAFDPRAPLRNTRTVLARAWERLFICPHHVNFHLEHHLLMTVPHYRLPRLHAKLKARGVLEHACVARDGYARVLARAASAKSAAGVAA